MKTPRRLNSWAAISRFEDLVGHLFTCVQVHPEPAITSAATASFDLMYSGTTSPHPGGVRASTSRSGSKR